MKADQLIVGGKYNWKNQPERLVYMGLCEPRNGRWHQFARVDTPTVAWCEVRDEDLSSFEETPPARALDGYATAFYELAALMGMTAQPLSPQTVWREQMLPTLRATLAAGSQAVQVPGWRPADDEIRQAWDDLQKREEAALQALRAARIGSTCAACGVGKLAADGNGYNNFERCDSCSHVPFWDENGVDMIAKLAAARAAPLQPLAGGEVK